MMLKVQLESLKLANKTHLFFVSLIAVFLGACSSKTINTKEYSSSTPHTKYKYFSSMEYDRYGLPQFKEELFFRPISSMDTRYYVVEYNASNVVTYFLVNVSEPEGEYLNTMRFIYEDTFKGFIIGGAVTLIAVSSFQGATMEPDVFLGVVLAPIAIGTTGGFVYGVGHSGYEFYLEAKDNMFIEHKEQLISYAKLEYDSSNRLSYLHEYNHVRQHIHTREFTYNHHTSKLCQTKVQDGDVRNILFKEDCY